jgi:hypothetical protein
LRLAGSAAAGESARRLVLAAAVQKSLNANGATDDQPVPLPTPLPLPKRLPVSYKGAPIDSFGLTLVAPDFPGVYSVGVESQGKSIAENQPWLLIQV